MVPTISLLCSVMLVIVALVGIIASLDNSETEARKLKCSSTVIVNVELFSDIDTALTEQKENIGTIMFLNLQKFMELTSTEFSAVIQKATPCNFVYLALTEDYQFEKSNFSNKNIYIFYASATVLQSLSQSEFIHNLRHRVLVPWKPNVSPVSSSSVTSFTGSLTHIRNAHLKFTIWNLSPWYAEVPAKCSKYLNSSGYRALPACNNVVRNQLVPIGVNYNLIPMAARAYNFTYELLIRPPIINRLENGTFMGIMGDIQSGRADILIALSATTERMEAATIGTYAHCVELMFITRREGTRADWTAFIAPFSATLWAAVLCLLLTTSLVGSSTLYIARSSRPVYTGFRTACTSLILQSVRIPRSAVSAQIVFIAWTFTSMILVHYYQSDLLAKLTIPQEEHTPRTFKQLAERNDYRIGLDYVRGSVSHTFFASAPRGSDYAEIRDRMLLHPSRHECVKNALKRDKRACISIDVLLKSVLASNFTEYSESHDYVRSSDQTLSVYGAVLFRNDSKYAEDMNSVVGWVRDCGMFLRWFREYYDIVRQQALAKLKSGARRGRQHGESAKAFNFDVLSAPFLFLITGCVVSLGCLSVEGVWAAVVVRSVTTNITIISGTKESPRSQRRLSYTINSTPYVPHDGLITDTSKSMSISTKFVHLTWD